MAPRVEGLGGDVAEMRSGQPVEQELARSPAIERHQRGRRRGRGVRGLRAAQHAIAALGEKARRHHAIARLLIERPSIHEDPAFGDGDAAQVRACGWRQTGQRAEQRAREPAHPQLVIERQSRRHGQLVDPALQGK